MESYCAEIVLQLKAASPEHARTRLWALIHLLHQQPDVQVVSKSLTLDEAPGD